MEDNCFVTTTSPKSNIIYCTILTLIEGLIFGIIMLLLPQFLTYVSLGCALICVVTFGTGFMLAFAPPVTLRFVDDELYIHDTNNKESNIYAVSASDFVFMQTPLEKKYDMACLRIKGTIFLMFGVRNVAATKAYIDAHFTHY